MSDKIDRLKSQLMTSGLQNKDNPLFQVINQLIDAFKAFQVTVLAQIAAISGGNVVGPGTSINNDIVRFDGTTGKLIQGSGITIPDGASGTLSGTNTGDVTLAGTGTYLSLTGQVLTQNPLVLTSEQVRDAGYWTPLVNVIGPGDAELVISDAGMPIAVWNPTP